ncbi:MAG: alpha/beta fold hydrolase [Sphingobium sp.]|nr:alpha/beta fold hydrolase [Sphingobium sp.]
MEFKSLDGTPLAAFLYTPDSGSGPFPAIVLSHGFGAVKEMALDRYADVFCAAGFACLVYDHRNTGSSGGAPRGEIDPWQQISDMRDAITYVESRAEVDTDRIGLWGTSFSGGHSLVVAATDRRVKCVVSVVPTISGHQNTIRALTTDGYAAFVREANEERAARQRGEEPRMIPISKDGDESYEWSKVAGVGTTYVNTCTLLSRAFRDAFEPGSYIAAISPTPLLLALTAHDTKCLTDLQLEAYSRAHEPKRLEMFPGGHYDPYTTQLAAIASASRDWFGTYLK